MTQFLLVAHDIPGQPEKRTAARPAHLAGSEALRTNGQLHYAAALLDDQATMIGSMMVLDFADRDALDAWLAQEPYVTGHVWGEIAITPLRPAPAFAPQP